MKARLSLEDTALTGVSDVLQRIRELAVQAGNSGLTYADRLAIAAEVKQSLDAVLSAANTTGNNGDYLFAGYQSTTIPFAQSSSGGFTYAGDDGQRKVQVGSSLFVADSDPGSVVFRNIKNGNGTFQTAAAGNTMTPGPNLGSAVIDPGSVSGSFVPDTYTLAFTQVPLSNPPSFTYTVTNSAAAVIAGPTAYVDRAGIDLSAVGIKTSVSGTPADGDTFTLRTSTQQDVFQTIQNFVTALQGNAPGTGGSAAAGQAAFQNALNRVFTDLDQAMGNVLNTQVQIGARLNTLDQQAASNDAYTLQLRATLSSLEDLDYAEAVSRMNLQLTGLQAAQQSFVRVQNLSLFNYLR